MTDLIAQLVSRSRGEARVVQPRLPAFFEPDQRDGDVEKTVAEPPGNATSPPEPTSRGQQRPAPDLPPRIQSDAFALSDPDRTGTLQPPPAASTSNEIPETYPGQGNDPVPLPEKQAGPAPPPAWLPSVTPGDSEREDSGPFSESIPTNPSGDPTAASLESPAIEAAPSEPRPAAAVAPAPPGVPVEPRPSLGEAVALQRPPVQENRTRVEVRINKIEVKAPGPPQEPAVPPSSRRRGPRISLHDYLSRKNRRRAH